VQRFRIGLAILGMVLLPWVNSARAQEPLILSRVHINPANPIDFHAYVTPETLFIGQQATYQVAVFIDDAVRPLLRRNPEFLPPELRGLLAYDLATPAPFASREAGGKHYGAHVFLKALFPLATGALVIPSSKLSYSMPQSSSYFSREENHVVTAESSVVIVKPLPTEGRPTDFNGAVGVLKSSVRLDTTTARVGDPLILTLRVQGIGNVKLLPRPTLQVEWATAVPGTERLQVDTSGPMVKGAKEFDWILTPSRDGEVTTPAIAYTYFNPYTRKYEVAESDVVSLNVQAGTLATAAEGEQSATVLPLRAHGIGDVARPVPERNIWWVLLLLMPLPAIALMFAGAPRATPKAAPIDSLRSMAVKPSARGASNRAAESVPPGNARDVRRLLLSSLSRRLDISADGLNDRARTQRVMLRRGVTRDTTHELLAKLAELDVASFSAESMLPQNAEALARSPSIQTLTAEALALYERVDTEAIPSKETRERKLKRVVKPIVATALVLLVGSVTTSAMFAQTPASEWAAAVSKYTSHNYVAAAQEFQNIAIASPRDADALANWGIASWAAGDTVSAVMAWQRAVRLDPLAADLRDDLLLLPPGAREGVADVPMVPVPTFAYGGALFWVLGWSALTVVLWRKRKKLAPFPAVGAFAITAIAIGAFGAGAAVWGARQLRSDALSVVVRPETIRVGPAPESDALGGAATGDIVRVERKTALWSRVQHADGREGWFPSDHLSSLLDSTAQ
jgi:hypothetical protein